MVTPVGGRSGTPEFIVRRRAHSYVVSWFTDRPVLPIRALRAGAASRASMARILDDL